MVAARDPVGIKPLFWARRDGLVAFASEVKAFDDEWQEDVELFPPGDYWTPGEGLVRFREAGPRPCPTSSRRRLPDAPFPRSSET